jgi:asparagine synthase (glutamine-hydrolysing)
VVTVFAGVVSLAGAEIDPGAQDRISRSIAGGKTPANTRRVDGAFFVQQIPFDLAEEVGLLFAADARLDNRAEIGAALGFTATELVRLSDSALILRAYRRGGDAGLARCLGAFAFALWDAERRCLTLARDCLGERPLFFNYSQDRVAFATTPRALFALPGVPREIDEIAVANYLALNLSEARRTFYRGVERVPSRTLVEISPDGVAHRHYWSPDLAVRLYRRDEDYIERARELLDQAVSTATADTPRVAISTSGGLDSSALAATAARLGRAQSVTCYTAVPPAGMTLDIEPGQYLDERDKVEALARMHPILDVRFCIEGTLHPFEQDFTRFFARSDMPVLGPANLGAFAHVHDAVTAAGHLVMLDGSMGNFGLSWLGHFSLLALLRAGKIAMLRREFLAVSMQGKRGLLRTFADDMLLPGVPAHIRRLLYRLDGRDPDSVARFSVLNPAFVAGTGLDRQWRRHGFDPWFGPNGWNPARHRARFLFDHNQYARDYRALSRSIHGFEIRDPHADRRLLEFLLTVPEPLYRRDGIARSFARAVLADRLPREILDERRKGYQGATWFRRLDARHGDFAAEVQSLEASPVASRLLDLPRIKKLIQQWPENETAASMRRRDYRLALSRGLHVGRFIRWVEGGNA